MHCACLRALRRLRPPAHSPAERTYRGVSAPLLGDPAVTPHLPSAALSCRGEIEDARAALVSVEPERRPCRLYPEAWLASAELTCVLVKLEPRYVAVELREVSTRASFGFLSFRSSLTGWSAALREPRWGWGWQRALRALLPPSGAPTHHLLASILADEAWMRCNQAWVDLRIRACEPTPRLPWLPASAAEVRELARLVAALRHPDPAASLLAWELAFELDCPPGELIELAEAATR